MRTTDSRIIPPTPPDVHAVSAITPVSVGGAATCYRGSISAQTLKFRVESSSNFRYDIGEAMWKLKVHQGGQ